MDYNSDKILCPFYITERRNQITCEGVMSKQEIFVFGDVTGKRRHMNKYCKKAYTECPHYKKASGKYER